jgi:hypothetical protein
MVKHRQSRGGGYSTQVNNMISPGYATYQQYEGTGKDCAGDVTRPGFMGTFSSRGLPGLSGGRRSQRQRRSQGGTQLQVANFEDMPMPPPPPMASPPTMPEMPTTMPMVSAPGVSDKPMQMGGRYEINPGSLIAGSSIGMSGPAPFGRIACEAGTTNELNPNMELQMATTAIRGGKRGSKRRGSKRRGSKRRKTRGGALTGAPVSFSGSSNFPVVRVGAADSMAYNAPSAGYRNDFEALPSGGAVPGLTLQVPYAAQGSNPACGMTGGSKRYKKRGGASNPADYASPYSALSMDQVVNRSEFDGSTKGLPVKYGGSRRRSNKRSSRRSSKRSSKKQCGRKQCFTSKLKRFFHL